MDGQKINHKKDMKFEAIRVFRERWKDKKCHYTEQIEYYPDLWSVLREKSAFIDVEIVCQHDNDEPGHVAMDKSQYPSQSSDHCRNRINSTSHSSKLNLKDFSRVSQYLKNKHYPRVDLPISGISDDTSVTGTEEDGDEEADYAIPVQDMHKYIHSVKSTSTVPVQRSYVVNIGIAQLKNPFASSASTSSSGERKRDATQRHQKRKISKGRKRCKHESE